MYLRLSGTTISDLVPLYSNSVCWIDRPKYDLATVYKRLCEYTTRKDLHLTGEIRTDTGVGS